MDHAFLVRVLDGVANIDEEFEALSGGEIILVTVLGDLHAADQLHDEIRAAGAGGAAIKHLGDIRMIHHREGLALDFEARDDAAGIHAELDDLQRYAAADRLLLFGHVNHAATAFANVLEQFVSA